MRIWYTVPAYIDADIDPDDPGAAAEAARLIGIHYDRPDGYARHAGPAVLGLVPDGEGDGQGDSGTPGIVVTVRTERRVPVGMMGLTEDCTLEQVRERFAELRPGEAPGRTEVVGFTVVRDGVPVRGVREYGKGVVRRESLRAGLRVPPARSRPGGRLVHEGRDRPPHRRDVVPAGRGRQPAGQDDV